MVLPGLLSGARRALHTTIAGGLGIQSVVAESCGSGGDAGRRKSVAVGGERYSGNPQRRLHAAETRRGRTDDFVVRAGGGRGGKNVRELARYGGLVQRIDA